MKQQFCNALVTLPEAIELINEGTALTVAGPEALLNQLPRGNWIGGTSSYFSAAEGGVKATDKLFVTTLPENEGVAFDYYSAEGLHHMMQHAPENGFSFAIIPAGNAALQRFAGESRFWPDILIKPVVGWIAGIDLDELGQSSPKIYNGHAGTQYDDGVIVAHVTLPAERIALIETVNIFQRDLRTVIRFPGMGFTAQECTVNGRAVQLADYLASQDNADGRLPLIGDFGGASINVSIQSINPTSGLVTFYAPVFADVEYYLALPLTGTDYHERFVQELKKYADKYAVFSCNCILNHLYGFLEGRSIGSLHGPVTFGELAYLLHNQTMVILTID